MSNDFSKTLTTAKENTGTMDVDGSLDLKNFARSDRYLRGVIKNLFHYMQALQAIFDHFDKKQNLHKDDSFAYKMAEKALVEVDDTSMTYYDATADLLPLLDFLSQEITGGESGWESIPMPEFAKKSKYLIIEKNIKISELNKAITSLRNELLTAKANGIQEAVKSNLDDMHYLTGMPFDTMEAKYIADKDLLEYAEHLYRQVRSND